MARQRNVHGWEIREQLLHGKEATPLAPWIQTHEPLPAQARRREGPAPWAVPLMEAVVMGLRGDVLEAWTRRVEGATFCGPRGTGKSLCATEASRYAHRELRTVEGHEAMQPVDLLGIQIVDHVVIGGDGAVSLKEQGLMQ